jgi:hypothetical protein
MTQPITSPSPACGVPFPPTADPVALLRAQQRLLGACARSGLILGEAARDCAERQVAIGRAAMRELWAAAPAAARGEPAGAAADWFAGLVRELSAGLEAMRRTLLEAQLAVLEELRRAVAAEPAVRVETEAGAAAAAAVPSEPAAPEPVPAAEAPGSIGAGAPQPALAAEVATGAASERPGETGEVVRPRRSRRIAGRS